MIDNDRLMAQKTRSKDTDPLKCNLHFGELLNLCNIEQEFVCVQIIITISRMHKMVEFKSDYNAELERWQREPEEFHFG